MPSSESEIVLTAPALDKDREGTPCGICRRQFSKYTCPSCNVGYCSLKCFRSESHSACSEKFYRKEIESDIKTAPSKSAEERTKMMSLLKRFEEAAPDEHLDENSDSEGDEHGLTERLASLDLESASYDEVWARLTPDERKRFLKIMANPSGELAQRLLASEELGKSMQEPWWEAPFDHDASVATSAKRYGVQPSLMAVPQSMIKPTAQGPTLIYNICAVFIAYAYVTRHLSVSPLGSLPPNDSDRSAARNLVSAMVPFVVDRRSKVVHSSLSSAVTDTWSRCDSMDATLFSILLNDVAKLVRPSLATVASPAEENGKAAPLHTHPHKSAVLALSDLAQLFETRQARPLLGDHTGQNHITHKLRFYAATVLSTPSSIFARLADEAVAKAKAIGSDGK